MILRVFHGARFDVTSVHRPINEDRPTVGVWAQRDHQPRDKKQLRGLRDLFDTEQRFISGLAGGYPCFFSQVCEGFRPPQWDMSNAGVSDTTSVLGLRSSGAWKGVGSLKTSTSEWSDLGQRTKVDSAQNPRLKRGSWIGRNKVSTLLQTEAMLDTPILRCQGSTRNDFRLLGTPLSSFVYVPELGEPSNRGNILLPATYNHLLYPFVVHVVNCCLLVCKDENCCPGRVLP